MSSYLDEVEAQLESLTERGAHRRLGCARRREAAAAAVPGGSRTRSRARR